jgi:hypothetical protein
VSVDKLGVIEPEVNVLVYEVLLEHLNAPRAIREKNRVLTAAALIAWVGIPHQVDLVLLVLVAGHVEAAVVWVLLCFQQSNDLFVHIELVHFDVSLLVILLFVDVEVDYVLGGLHFLLCEVVVGVWKDVVFKKSFFGVHSHELSFGFLFDLKVDKFHRNSIV